MNRKQKYRVVFALVEQIGQKGEHRSVIHTFTNGQKESLTDLTDKEVDQLIELLKVSERAKNEKMRKAIIGELASIGWTTMEDKPDMTRINNFIKGIGSYNPKGRTVGRLNHYELMDVLTQVRAMTKKEREKQEFENGK